MKLTIKTLQRTQFKIDIEDDKTVKELKEKIETDHGKEYPSGAQKLIYDGKILADECKLSEYKVDEKKFIVLIIPRPPPAPKVQPKTEPTKVEQWLTTSASSTSTPVKKEDVKPKTEQPKTTTTQSTSSTQASNTTTTTTTNPTTTASTLQNQQPANRLLSSLERSTLPLDNNSEQPQMSSRLAAMMNQPHFRQIQDLIQQSPHLLSSTIEALAGTDPEMYNFISDNPDVFVNALNHQPLAGSRGSASTRSSTVGRGQQQSTQQTDMRTSSGGRQQLLVDQILPNVSEHDKEAIERLKELGFSEYQAVQAYIACDKDEQLAANLLFQMEQ